MTRELYFADRAEWRAWLQKNSDTTNANVDVDVNADANPNANEVWLIYYKKHTGKPSISYEASVEEALCFGWVDSIIKRLDADRCARKFTPRKGNSTWSESNKRRAEKMISEGRMTKTGMAKITEARKSGEWSRVREVSKEFVVPAFVQNALTGNEKACAFFGTLANSYKRQIVDWVSSAKKEETRSRRLAEVISLLEKNQRLGLK